MKAHVRMAADVSSRGKTHAQTRKHAQMATQVDPGMRNMPGEEQVTAGLGYICLFFFNPLPLTNRNLFDIHLDTAQTRKCSCSTWRAGGAATAEDLGCVHRSSQRFRPVEKNVPVAFQTMPMTPLSRPFIASSSLLQTQINTRRLANLVRCAFKPPHFP